MRYNIIMYPPNYLLSVKCVWQTCVSSKLMLCFASTVTQSDLSTSSPSEMDGNGGTGASNGTFVLLNGLTTVHFYFNYFFLLRTCMYV